MERHQLAVGVKASDVTPVISGDELPIPALRALAGLLVEIALEVRPVVTREGPSAGSPDGHALHRPERHNELTSE